MDKMIKLKGRKYILENSYNNKNKQNNTKTKIYSNLMSFYLKFMEMKTFKSAMVWLSRYVSNETAQKKDGMRTYAIFGSVKIFYFFVNVNTSN